MILTENTQKRGWNFKKFSVGLYQVKRKKSQEQNINIRLSRSQTKDTEYGK